MNPQIADSLTTMESCSRELTVFYDGKIHVFRNVPAVQVQALMLLLHHPEGNGVDGDVRPVKRPVDGTTSSSSSDISIDRRCTSNRVQPAEQLPFARKASLARFLKVRNTRVIQKSK